MSIYDDLKSAMTKWQARDYSLNIYKSKLENKRDNEVNAISNLLYRYETVGNFTEAEIKFAEKLISNSKR